MKSLSRTPDHILIQDMATLEAARDEGLDSMGVFRHALENVEKELESRHTLSQLEYDHNGNIITSEVIGYVDGEEIWPGS